MTTSTMMSAGKGSSCPAVAATTMLAGSGCLAQVWRKGRRYMKKNKGKKDKRMTQTIKNEVKKEWKKKEKSKSSGGVSCRAVAARVHGGAGNYKKQEKLKTREKNRKRELKAVVGLWRPACSWLPMKKKRFKRAAAAGKE